MARARESLGLSETSSQTIPIIHCVLPVSLTFQLRPLALLISWPAYDYHAQWDTTFTGQAPVTNPHTSIPDMQDSVLLYIRGGIDMSKVNIGQGKHSTFQCNCHATFRVWLNTLQHTIWPGRLMTGGGTPGVLHCRFRDIRPVRMNRLIAAGNKPILDKTTQTYYFHDSGGDLVTFDQADTLSEVQLFGHELLRWSEPPNKLHFFYEEEHYDEDLTDPQNEVPREKPTSTKAVRLSRRGILEQLLAAPLDILYEIFCYLEPLDILRLSVTSKNFHDLLMQDPFVWRHARKNVGGLPDPPKNGIHEAQYANLVFGSLPCHYCRSSTHVTEIMWALRIRCCQTCIEEYFQTPYWQDFRMHGTTEDAFKKVLKVLFCRRSVQTFYLAGNAAVDIIVEAYYKRHVDEALVDYSGIQTNASCEHWLTRKAADKASIEQWADECRTWFIEYNNAQAEIFEKLRDKRYNDIVRRLIQLGWERELQEMEEHDEQSAFRAHSLVNQTKELTSRTWAQIRPELLQWMEYTRGARLEREEKDPYL
ncbi:hypothetical protein C8J56DRAFT_1165588 [Mycena floridula]|nr:hypothetical protein C8J56DRAFT_1165588 [Mycena floridula]